MPLRQPGTHPAYSAYRRDIVEIGKIIPTATTMAITYGIVHDLITTQINFDYFASDLTHHGPYTREHFPYVYQTNNKVLYAVLWGTLATWWIGVPLGVMWGIAARCNPEKLDWHDLIKPITFFSASMLVTSLGFGLLDYVSYKDSFSMVATMHHVSYAIGIVGGLSMTYYIYTMKKSARPVQANIVQVDPMGITINLVI